ncbi:MAG: acyl carrier protein [Candidatus Dadabacteria bacterium]|nr:acyl carrier protein [Candidatus Dadabacteria bacterium]
MNHIQKVRAFIIENFLFGESVGFREDASFLENGIVDSTGILELINFLEETFNIIIEDEEIIPENLDTLVSIGRFLDAKLGLII